MANNLKRIREELGLTQPVMAKRMGTTKNQLIKLESGKRRLTEEWIQRASKATGRPLTDFIEEHGPLIGSFDPDMPDTEEGDFDPSEHGGVSTDMPYVPDTIGASPVIDTRAGAGPGSIGLPAVSPSGGVIYAEDAVLGEILLPAYLHSSFTHAPPGRLHWLQVRGDSMFPTLNGGDHVGTDTTDTAIGQGGIFVARNGDGEIIVKRFFRVPKSDPPQIEIRSDNDQVEPARTVDADWVTIIGRVVAKIARIG